MAFYMVKILFYEKKYGLIISIIIFIPLIVRTNYKIIFHNIFKNQDRLDKYKFRLDGLLKSIQGKKSFLRP